MLLLSSIYEICIDQFCFRLFLDLVILFKHKDIIQHNQMTRYQT